MIDLDKIPALFNYLESKYRIDGYAGIKEGVLYHERSEDAYTSAYYEMSYLDSEGFISKVTIQDGSNKFCHFTDEFCEEIKNILDLYNL